MKLLIRLTILLLIAGGAWLTWEVVRAQRGRAQAVRFMSREAWPQARVELQRYLRLHPSDAKARLMLAESYARDESSGDVRNVELAIVQLQRVPDDSPQGAKARAHEGRMRFLILDQPMQAERLFRRAIELAPDGFDAHFMLWKLLDMTGRHQLTEPIFWRVLELCPVPERPLRMREWYLSEFSPGMSTAPLDEKMGVADETERSGLVAEFRRLQRFRVAEPDSPVATAALARLFLRQGVRAQAQEFLESAQLLEGAFDNPYYVAAWIALLMDLGEFDRVGELFDRWPGSRTGFEYWKWEGIICDEIRHDDACASTALDRATEAWPGTLDWQLMYRKAHCLARSGSHRQAEEVRAQAHAIEQLMEKSVQARVRKAMSQLNDPQQIAVIVDYYQKLNRPREAEFWKNHSQEIERTKQNPFGLGEDDPGVRR